MTEQTIHSRPAVQQASAPYTHEERIGSRWAPALLYTAGVAFVAAATRTSFTRSCLWGSPAS